MMRLVDRQAGRPAGVHVSRATVFLAQCQLLLLSLTQLPDMTESTQQPSKARVGLPVHRGKMLQGHDAALIVSSMELCSKYAC